MDNDEASMDGVPNSNLQATDINSSDISGGKSQVPMPPPDTPFDPTLLGDDEGNQPDDYQIEPTTRLSARLPAAPPSQSVIHFSAKDRATLFVNGRKTSATKHWHGYRAVTRVLGRGDVVGIKAHNRGGWHGVIADVQIGNTHHVTGSSKHFRAIAAFPSTRWLHRAYNACRWHSPYVVTRPARNTFAKNFPYASGAKFVWARGAPHVGTIFMRFTIEPPVTACTPSASPSLSPAGGGRKTCACAQTDDVGGACYVLARKKGTERQRKQQRRRRRRVCKARRCGRRYECMRTSGEGDGKQCLVRFAQHKLVMRKRLFKGMFECAKVRLRKPREFLVPYE